MVVRNVHTILTSTLPQWKTLDYSDAEMSLMLLYMLGEALPVSNTVSPFPSPPSLHSSVQFGNFFSLSFNIHLKQNMLPISSIGTQIQNGLCSNLVISASPNEFHIG